MEPPSLLNDHVDYDHRGKLLKYYGFHDNTHHIEPLQCRTPNEYWMIHPGWVDRYKVICIDITINSCLLIIYY
jgi:hypothetical protein